MRRGLLLTVGLLWAGVFLALLCSAGMRQYAAAMEPSAPVGIGFPCKVADTQLVARQLVVYEGAFREDGSNREAGEMAALIVTNEGSTMISEGAVILDWGKDRLVFEIFALPPGATALVQEKQEKPYTDQLFTASYGWNRTEYPENNGAVTVEEAGMTCMLVINHTDAPVSRVQIRYKSYDAQNGIYMGGICYAVTVEDLRPGEARLVSPEHFLCGHSRVVSITMEYD